MTAATGHRITRNSPSWSAALCLALAVLVRLMMFGKPAFQSDEEFYLLVGQRMAEGALPYVDLWDRKPYGLFLIYRSVFLLPFDPVLTYQVVGLIFSVATALVIERIARLIAPPRGALLAALAYLLYQAVFNSALGQSPVFYNLPVALAALWVARAGISKNDPSLIRRGCAAMLLLGLAMQIKYSALFEGLALGLLLLRRGRADGWGWPRLTGAAAVWIAVALAPTCAVILGYALSGHADAFIQANFHSIFGRRTEWPDAFAQIAKEALALTPFALAILHAPRRLSFIPGEVPAALPALRFWALFALGGFVAFPPWYDHYLGPVLVPLCVLAAPALGHEGRPGRWYGRLLLGLGGIGAIVVPTFQIHERGSAQAFAQASALVAGELKGRCLYVYEGDSALYRTTRACIPTRFAYPSHLNSLNEARALGVDPVGEVRRIMASRPGVVVVAESGRPNLPNLATRAVLHSELATRYERYAGVTIGTRKFGLYRLRD